ncbi:MAG: endonuclease [Candidatus Kaiserbacteria bacterium]|nr:endonuclease [Candidatus Kaiserbacteria bacterium]
MLHWREHGRHDLPWRQTADPYKILVSEIMLQQTQVSRVIEKYSAFIKRFPTIKKLAAASLSDVLQIWIGLGYNRRAKFLHEASKIVTKEYGGNLKKALEFPLPGIGPYTRAAVRTFAFNEPHPMIETNIRTVYIHHFFPHTIDIYDRQILSYVEKAGKGMEPRIWYWALMDYGAHLKLKHPNPSRKSAHHATQSKFEGSLRQVRGAILKSLNGGGKTLAKLYTGLPYEKLHVDLALTGLAKDGMIIKRGNTWQII